MTAATPTSTPPRVVAGTLPPAARAALDAAGLNHRPVIVSVDTDVSLDGEPRREWLFVTPDHLSVVREGLPLEGEERFPADGPGPIALASRARRRPACIRFVVERRIVICRAYHGPALAQPPGRETRPPIARLPHDP